MDLMEEHKWTAGLLSMFFSVLLTCLICLLIYKSFHFSVDMSDVKSIFAVSEDEFAPEPMERVLFLVSLAITPVFLFIFYRLSFFLLNRFTVNKTSLIYNSAYFGISGLVILMALAGIREDKYFFLRNTVSGFPGFAGVGISTVAAYFIMLNPNNKTDVNLINKVLLVLLNLFSMALVVLSAVYCVYGINSITEDIIFNYHFNSVFHAVVQVYSGKELLVDLFNIYGMYPHFLEPVFKIFGLSVLSFTVFMGLLLGLSMFLIYRFLKEITENKIIGCLGFIASVYYSYIFGRLISNDPYFQYHPLRFLFPALSIYMVYRYFKSHGKKLYYISFTLYSAAALWNFDTGFVVFTAWLLALLFQELSPLNLKNMLSHILKGMAIFAAVFMAFNLYLYIRYGHVPAYQSFLVYQKMFYSYGYMMLPMTVVHPWNLIALVYAAGLLFSFSSLSENSLSVKPTMSFFLSILGAGLFTYFQGRSHDFNLATVSFPAIILAAVFADILLSRIKAGRNVGGRLVFVSILFFLIFASANMVKAYPVAAKTAINRLRPTLDHQATPVTRGADFVKENTSKGEEILLLSNLSGVYYLESGTTCPLKIPGPTELFLAEDFNKIIKYMEDDPNAKVLLDDNFFPENGYKDRIMDLAQKNFIIQAMNPDGNMMYLERLKE